MTPWLRSALVVVVSVSALSCRIGPNPSRSPAARSVHGLQIVLEVPQASAGGEGSRVDVVGELIAVRDDGLLVDAGLFFRLFEFDSFTQVRPLLRRDSPPPGYYVGTDAEAFGTLRAHARHPYGLTDEQLDTLLRARGQPDLIVERRR